MANEMITIVKVDRSKSDGAHPKVGVQDSKNRWFGVFDQALWPRLTEGANLNVEWTTAGEGGRYKNITAILGTASSPNGTTNGLSRDEQIARHVALKAAVEMLGPLPFATDSTDQILHVADTFLAWLEDKDTSDSPF